MVTIPDGLQSEYPTIAVIFFVCAALLTGSFFLLKYFFAESEKSRAESSKLIDKIIDWQTEQSELNRCHTARENSAFRDVLLKIVETVDSLSKRMEIGFTEVQERIQSHDEKIEIRSNNRFGIR